MKSLPSFVEQAGISLRMVVPYALILLLFILNIVAWTFPFFGSVKASMFLMGIYYWAVYRPTLIPPWVVFICGLLMDFFGGLPVGLNAFVYLVFQWVVIDQRRFLMGQNFIMIWFGFCVLNLATILIQWCIFGIIQMQWPSLETLMVSTGLSCALFPSVYVFMHLTHKIIPLPDPTMRFSS